MTLSPSSKPQPPPSPTSEDRQKQVAFSIVRKITEEEYLVATFGAFGMFMGAYFVVTLVSCLICVRKRRLPLERSLFEGPSRPPPRPLSRGSRYGSVSSSASGSSVGSRGGGGARRRTQGRAFYIGTYNSGNELNSGSSSEFSDPTLKQENDHIMDS